MVKILRTLNRVTLKTQETLNLSDVPFLSCASYFAYPFVIYINMQKSNKIHNLSPCHSHAKNIIPMNKNHLFHSECFTLCFINYNL